MFDPDVNGDPEESYKACKHGMACSWMHVSKTVAESHGLDVRLPDPSKAKMQWHVSSDPTELRYTVYADSIDHDKALAGGATTQGKSLAEMK